MSIKHILGAVAIFGLLLLSFGSVAQAQGDFYDLFLRIDGQGAIDNGNVDSPIIVSGAGDFTAQVILRETVGNGTPWLGNSGGLTSVNFTIAPTLGAGNLMNEASPFAVLDNSTAGRINGIGLSGPSGVNPGTPPGVFETNAGSFSFSFDGSTGNISLADGSGGADFGLFVGGGVGAVNLDDMITFRTATITTAVPEPGSFALLGLGAVGMVMRRRRR